MVKKRLVVLANSIKREDRCIAGREVIEEGGRYRFGEWVRPISDRGQGELNFVETMCSDGSQVRVRDLAEVSLTGLAHDRDQPENWRLAGPRCWRRMEWRFDAPGGARLVESPPDLWLDGAEERTNRISHERLRRRPPAPSLYVIRPERLRLKFFSKRNPADGRDDRKSRGVFEYNGVEYELPLTDPVASAKYCRRFPAVHEAPKVVDLSGRAGPLACVSLGGNFGGFHYKILATVIEW